jgi:hypothetical protein
MVRFGILGLIVIVIAVIVVRYWLINRPQSVSVKPKRRGLFRFNDGAINREVDPIDVLARFEEHPEFRHDLHPKRCERGEVEALKILADAVRVAFQVPEYTEPGKPGLTVRECFELYAVFAHFIAFQKKSTNRSQISPQDSAATSNDSEKPTTNDMLGSGSTDSELMTSKA